jgi:hypothetical protein
MLETNITLELLLFIYILVRLSYTLLPPTQIQKCLSLPGRISTKKTKGAMLPLDYNKKNIRTIIFTVRNSKYRYKATRTGSTVTDRFIYAAYSYFTTHIIRTYMEYASL